MPSSSSSSSNASRERTEVLYGTENTTKAILSVLSNIESKMDICADSTWPSVAMGVDVFRKALINLKKRDVRSRYITTVTKANMYYCKEAMKIGELRHLDDIKGNFSVSEKEYMASATMQEASPLQQVIYSNVKEVLEQQQYVFDSFWDRSIPAEHKIKEIEEGVVLGKTEVIQSPKDIQQLFINMVKLAKREVLLVLPTVNAFYREERIGIIELLKQASEGDHRVNVRILTPTNDAIENISSTPRHHIDEEERTKQNHQIKNKEKRFDIRSIDIESTNQDEDGAGGLAAAAAAAEEYDYDSHYSSS